MFPAFSLLHLKLAVNETRRKEGERMQKKKWGLAL